MVQLQNKSRIASLNLGLDHYVVFPLQCDAAGHLVWEL